MNRIEQQHFLEAATELPPLETEEDVIRHAPTIHNYLNTYFGSNNFLLAKHALFFLMSKKTRWIDGQLIIDTRRDEKTPDYLHELRQSMAIKSFHEQKYLPPSTRGLSIEILFCISLLHDMGEDFNVMPSDLVKFLSNEDIVDPGVLFGTKQIESQKMAYRIAEAVERMTFSRKYTASDIRSALLLPSDHPIGETERQAFVNKLNAVTPVTKIEKERPLQILSRQDDKGNYIVSRYVEDDIVDWNLYIESMVEDPYAILAKFFDRNEGLSTRIGKNFSIEGYSNYLTMTYISFSVDNISEDLKRNYPELNRAFHRLDSMMGVLHRIGRTYVSHHPDFKENKIKGFNISTMRNIDFRNYFPEAMEGYDGLPDGMNPLLIILNRIRTSKDLGASLDGTPNASLLHGKIQYSIHESLGKQSSNFMQQVGRIIGLSPNQK